MLVSDLDEATRQPWERARALTLAEAERVARLAQELSNLSTNAIKYAQGGEIRVTLRREGEHLLVSVSVRGPGIPPARAESIFEPGNRLDQEIDDRSPEGVGFGLHIAKGIVKAHGGSADSSTMPKTWQFEPWLPPGPGGPPGLERPRGLVAAPDRP